LIACNQKHACLTRELTRVTGLQPLVIGMLILLLSFPGYQQLKHSDRCVCGIFLVLHKSGIAMGSEQKMNKK
jgi:hypothetical protein